MKIDLINKSYLILFALLLPLAVWAEAKNSNIILIMADDLGAEGLNCYGSTIYTTPNLDRMAEEGMRFNNAYSTPLCSPTRVMIMTGLYPNRTRQLALMMGEDARMDPQTQDLRALLPGCRI
jgi:arylsulfatase A-like enzyme